MNKVLISMIAILIMTGLSNIAFAQWPMDGHDAGRSGYHPGVFSTQHVVSGQKAFNASVSEIIVGGDILFARIDNATGEYVVALDAASYQTNWIVGVPDGPDYGGFVYTGSMLLVAHDDGVISLGMSGNQLWEIDNASSEGLLLRENYLLSVDLGTTRMYNLANRQLLWYKTHGFTERYLSEYVIGDDAVYLHRGNTLTAYDIFDGHEIYEKTNVTLGNARLVYSGGRLFVGTSHGEMLCINAATGNVSWTFDTDGKKEGQFLPEAMTPAVGGGNIVFGAFDDKLYCLGESGNLKWKTSGVSLTFGDQPAISDNLVFVIDEYDKVRCFDITAGNQLWSLTDDELGNIPTGNPVLYNGKIYGRTEGSGVYTQAYIFTIPEFTLPVIISLFFIVTFSIAMSRRRDSLRRARADSSFFVNS